MYNLYNTIDTIKLKKNAEINEINIYSFIKIKLLI